MNRKMVSGSFWLSFGSIMSRVLGIVYLIPWLVMMGAPAHKEAAQALFNVAYQPYALFISLGTAGFPSAIARRIAIYNGEDKFLNSRYLAKMGFAVMAGSGALCGLLLYLLAPTLAKNSAVVSVHDAVIAIRVLVPAIIILPSMSILRGWFQGNQDLKPFGISQLWEQLLRITFILAATYLIIDVYHLDFVLAVYYSVFGAFVGAVASYVYLWWYYRKQEPTYRLQAEQSQPFDLHGVGHSLLMIAYESIPFVFVGAGITLTQLIDQLFFKQVMVGVRHQTVATAQYIYTLFSANPTKITTVIVSLAIAIAETTLPLLATNKAAGKGGTANIISQNLNLLLFTLLPSVTILGALAPEIYGIFFSFNPLGTHYLVANIFQSIILGIAIDGLTLLQALHESKRAMVYLSIGLVVKLLLQFPMVYLWQGFGAIAATAIGFGVVDLLWMTKIFGQYHLRLRQFGRLLGMNLGYGVVTFSVSLGFNAWLQPETKLTAFLFACVFGGIFALLYVWLANVTGVATRVLGRPLKVSTLR
ncbi:polysaccharide biosynthesis protein [Levilactobacillus bambusae]|uniref:Sugar transporter n=1 Tax=Levilactobacillus bambusae TaxID=2024736 RepID=A0A2V1N2C4_9LACO|nr:polysaccharide biosynthesis protein [Levilactobacillus bambusae]PWG00340.1 sugar transporter [Levilactobacillus bambusae]